MTGTLTHQASVTLLMESRGFAKGGRTAAFAKTWSKLFQAGESFVDVSCTPEAGGAKFEGQVLFTQGEEAAETSLYLLRGSARQPLKLKPDGTFSISVSEPGLHTLELTLSGQQYLIDDLALI